MYCAGVVPMCLIHTEGDNTNTNVISEIIESHAIDQTQLLNGVKSRLPMIEDSNHMEKFLLDWLENLY